MTVNKNINSTTPIVKNDCLLPTENIRATWGFNSLDIQVKTKTKPDQKEPVWMTICSVFVNGQLLWNTKEAKGNRKIMLKNLYDATHIKKN